MSKSTLELAGILSDDEAAPLRAAVDDRRERRGRELEGIASELEDA